jgi:hypothetical protein
VKGTRTTHLRVAALTIGVALVAAAPAGAKPGPLQIRSEALNQKYDIAAMSALQARSEALNQRYHLGVAPSPVVASSAMHALQARSEALNQQYNIGAARTPVSTTGAVQALSVRGEALNQRYHLGQYAVVAPSTSGFDWFDAGVGSVAAFGAVLIAGGIAVGARRYRTTHLSPARTS